MSIDRVPLSRQCLVAAGPLGSRVALPVFYTWSLFQCVCDSLSQVEVSTVESGERTAWPSMWENDDRSPDPRPPPPLGLRSLRLLPLSGGVFAAGMTLNLSTITMEALQCGFSRLAPDLQAEVLLTERLELCIYMEKGPRRVRYGRCSFCRKIGRRI